MIFWIAIFLNHNSYSVIYFYSMNCLPISLNLLWVRKELPSLARPMCLELLPPEPREAQGCLKPPSDRFRPQGASPRDTDALQHPPLCCTRIVVFWCAHTKSSQEALGLNLPETRLPATIPHSHFVAKAALSMLGTGLREWVHKAMMFSMGRFSSVITPGK